MYWVKTRHIKFSLGEDFDVKMHGLVLLIHSGLKGILVAPAQT
jgi:hypothetical protein